ncbi:MAG: delta-aminolevulinic acid dehydratase [Acidobacteriota bacterium]|nr:delta-aminolevulinic acid dehydratase [Acidobacteriota bacterium]
MHNSIEQAFADLFQWCRERDFAGYDPFDALNSRILQATPLTHSRTARLIWTQLIKRSPLNLRPLARVPRQNNSKGIALFALASLSRYRRLKTAEPEKEARELLDELLRMQIVGYGGAAWGYNFDWQSRNFFAPQGTPMIVPTAFAVRALLDAYETLNDNKYLEAARSSCEFILKDLRRTIESDDKAGELCFSYSPLDETKVFNASLFAAETLTCVGALAGETEFSDVADDLAIRATRYVVRRQHEDGSWAYGAGPGQLWVDNFHTAYVLLSLSRIMKCLRGGQIDLKPALERGYRFWRQRFFLADGWPKYYHDTLYPADAHAAATAIITLVELQELDREALPLAETIAAWTMRNLRDSRGFFYYQRRRFYTVRTPFMRWTQAWMLYALARLLEK